MMISNVSKTREAWDWIATGFDRYVTPTGNWGLPKTALHFAGLKAGMKFLDVASGSGALSLPAARLGAEVMAVDISPVMIKRLQERANEERLPNLEGRVMDGHDLALTDNTFDMVGSQFGVMLFPDFQQGLREMVRVTRPGGTVFLVVFGPIQKVEFIGLYIQAIKEVVPEFTGIPMDHPPLPFQVSETGVLRRKMEEGGLKNVQVKPVNHELTFYSGEEMWKWVTNSNPIANEMISDLTDEQRTQVRQILDEMLQRRSDNNKKAVLKTSVHIGIGTK